MVGRGRGGGGDQLGADGDWIWQGRCRRRDWRGRGVRRPDLACWAASGWLAGGSGQAALHDPTCYPRVAAPCAQTCRPPRSTLGMTLLWFRCFFFLCVCRVLCARGLATGMLAVGLHDHGVPALDLASLRPDLVEPCCPLVLGAQMVLWQLVLFTRAGAVHAVWPRASQQRGCVSAGILPLCLSLGRPERRLSSTTMSAMLVLAVAVEAWWRH